MYRYVGIGVLTLILFLSACEGNGHKHLEHEMAADHSHGMIYVTNSGHAQFTSHVFGTIGIFVGESNNLTGMIDLEKNVIMFALDLSTLRTGIDQRDKDMFQLLAVDQHPFARFIGNLEHTFTYNSDEKQPVVASGEFTLNGITLNMEGEGYLQKQDNGMLLESEWILDITDYGIEPPKVFSVQVHREQEILIEATLAPLHLTSTP